MASKSVTVTISDLPAVKARIEQLETERDNLRALLRQWERRVTCLQCGQRYSDRACGPTHALIAAEVRP